MTKKLVEGDRVTMVYAEDPYTVAQRDGTFVKYSDWDDGTAAQVNWDGVAGPRWVSSESLRPLDNNDKKSR